LLRFFLLSLRTRSTELDFFPQPTSEVLPSLQGPRHFDLGFMPGATPFPLPGEGKLHLQAPSTSLQFLFFLVSLPQCLRDPFQVGQVFNQFSYAATGCQSKQLFIL